MPRLFDRILRALFMAAHPLLKRRGRTRFGVHAIALTPERRIVLVKLRYAPGWRLPGGGRDDREGVREAALRELREEIGMTAHGEVRPVPAQSDELLIVEDVLYRPSRWSWEIEKIMEAPLDALPPDLSSVAAVWIKAARSRI